MNKFKFAMPFLILLFLSTLLWHELFYTHQDELPSALIGEDVPEFKLPTLFANTIYFSSNHLRGQVSLLNVWASWCYACALEQPLLMKIANTYHVPIYGINYKDDASTAKNWLKEMGNPYVMTGIDQNGDVGIDLGIYGTPETFIISPNGKIVYRQVGAITQKVWDDVLYPIVKKYAQQPIASVAQVSQDKSLNLNR